MKTVLQNKIVFLPPEKVQLYAVDTDCLDRYRLLLLAESIKENGISVPVIVRKTKNGYKAVSGSRRIKASMLAGLKKIPCVVLSHGEAELIRAIDNLSVKQSDPFYEAEEICRLIKRLGQNSLAAALSCTSLELTRYIKIAALPDHTKERIRLLNLPTALVLCLAEKTEEIQNEILDMLEGIPHKGEKGTAEHLPDEPPKKKIPPLNDTRFFVNTIRRMGDSLKNSGVKLTIKQSETATFTDIKIRIEKEPDDAQLSLF